MPASCFDATAPDFEPVHRAVRKRTGAGGEKDAGRVLPGEREFAV